MSVQGHFRTSVPPQMMSALPLPAQPVDATLYLKGEMECALMGQRFHRGFTATEKTELWDRWKRGESLKAIGRAFGKPSSSIYFLVAPHGGIRPAQRCRSRLALTLDDRRMVRMTKLTECGHSHAADMLVALVDRARLLSQSRQLF